MTPEQKRIAIAEACGLFHIMPLKRTTRKGKDDPAGVVLWYCDEHHGGAATYAKIPDYLNDLNAMHKAEKVLTDEQRGQMIDHLCEIVRRDHNPEAGPMTAITAAFFATASQRARAFLETLGLWCNGSA